jgi:hypothetical protein
MIVFLLLVYNFFIFFRAFEPNLLIKLFRQKFPCKQLMINRLQKEAKKGDEKGNETKARKGTKNNDND